MFGLSTFGGGRGPIRAWFSRLWSVFAIALFGFAASGAGAVPALTGGIAQSVYSSTGYFYVTWSGGDIGALLEAQTAAYLQPNATSKLVYSPPLGSTVYTVTGKAAGVYFYTGLYAAPGGLAATNDIAVILYRNLPAISSWSVAYAGNALPLSWTTSAPAGGYILEQQYNGGAWTEIYTGAANSFTTAGLASGTYKFRVRPVTNYIPANFTSAEFTTTVISAATLTNPSYQWVDGSSYTISWSGADLGALLESQVAPYIQPNAIAKISYPIAPGDRSRTITGKAPGVYYYTGFSGLCSNCTFSNDIVAIVYGSSSTPVISSWGTAYAGNVLPISWTSPPPGGNFVLEQQLNGGDWTVIYNGSETTFTTAALAQGTYSFRVRPCWYYACAPFTSAIFTTNVVSPPTLTGGEYQSVYIGPPSNGSFAINWSGGDLNLLLEAQSAPFAQPNATGRINYTPAAGARSYIITGKTYGVFYYTGFVGLCYNCAATNDVTVIAYNQLPVVTAPPSNNTGAFAVNWTTVPLGGLYSLEQQIDGGAWVSLTPTTATSYSTTGLLSGTYSFRVHPCWYYVCAPFASATATTVVSVPPPATTMVPPPLNSTTGTYSLSWLAAPTATSYQIDQSVDYGNWITIYSGSGLGTNLFGNGNGFYQYRVRACNVSGCSSDSSVQSVSVLLPPNPPALNVPTSSNGTLSIAWVASPTATSYELERRLNGAGWSNLYSGTALSAAISGLATGIHDFQIKACNASGCGTYSASATTYVNVLPPAPGSISGPNPNGGRFTLAWTGTPGTGSYTLQERVGSGAWTTIANPASPSFAVSGRAAGTYSYQVKSCNITGCSVYSPTFTTVAVGAPTPTGLTAPASSSSAVYTVSWNASPLASSYELQSRPAGGAWVTIYTGANLSKSTNTRSGTFDFQVRACNDTGCSAFSAPVSSIVAVQNNFAAPINPADDADTDALYTGVLEGSLVVGKDGSANYAIPIVVPPGIHGEVPKLALTYNSNLGNGLMGWGWSISGLSQIQRCPATLVQDGYYAGTAHTNSYKYCLDGRRLVQIGANEYRTEEETFTRIKTIFNNGLPYAWVVEARDGHRYTYGGTADSRREDDDAAGVIVGWYLNRSEDKDGNFIDYIYAYNRTAATHRISAIEFTKNPVAQSVQNRLEFNYESRDDVIEGYSSQSRYMIDQRLRDISVYTTLAGSAQLLRKYVVSYVPWNGSSNADPAKTSRVESIKVCFGSDSVCSAATNFGWTSQASDRYKFQWTPYPAFGAGSMWPTARTADARSRYDYFHDGQLYSVASASQGVWKLKNVIGPTPFGPSLSPDGPVIATLPENTYTYHEDWKIDNGWSGGSSTEADLTRNTKTSANTVDLNGDGRKDVYFIDNVGSRGVLSFINTGSGFEQRSAYSLQPDDIRYWVTHRVSGSDQTAKLTGWATYKLAFIDMNGDGLVDVFRRPTVCQGCTTVNNRTDVSVALNTGNGFAPFATWVTTAYFPQLENTWDTRLQDMNGDGLPDLICWDGTVAINSGSGFTSAWSAPANLFPAGYNPDSRANVEFINGYREFALADVNGDGLPDMIDVRPAGILVSINDGSKMLPASIWSTVVADPYWRTSNPGVDLPPEYSFMDMNGDGKADVVRNGPNFSVAFSKGHITSGASQDGFSALVTMNMWSVMLFPQYSDIHTRPSASFYDVNMDGIAEPYGGACYNPAVSDPAMGTAACISQINPHRITAISDTVKLSQITYGNLSEDDFYTPVYNSISGTIADIALVGKAPVPTYAGTSDGGVNAQPIPQAYNNNVTTGRFAVKQLRVADSTGGDVTKSYRYKGLKEHRSGWGSLGFGEIKETEYLTTAIAETSPRRVVTTGFMQSGSSQYRLAEPFTRTVEVSPSAGTGLVRVEDSVDNLELRTWLDDVDANYKSPHFQLYRSAKQTNFYSYETGSLTHREAMRLRVGADKECTVAASFPVVYAAGSVSDTVYDSFGNLLKRQISVCEADNSLSLNLIENLGFADASVIGSGTGKWVLGLLSDRKETHTLYAPSRTVLNTQQRRTTWAHNSSGKTTLQTLEPGTPLEFSTAYSNFNAYGMPTAITESWPDDAEDGLAFNQRTINSTESYLSDGSRTVTESRSVNHVDGSNSTLSKTTTYGGRFGEVLSVYDWNNLITTWQYDGLGRAISETRPDGGQVSNRWRTCSSCVNTSAKYYVHSKEAGSAPSRTLYDALDREVGRRSLNIQGGAVYTARSYDKRGRLWRDSSPYFFGGQVYNTEYAYDYLDRVTSVTDPDGGVTHSTYDGLKKAVNNPLNQSTVSIYNGLGQLIETKDPKNTVAGYTYDAHGELIKTRIDNANDGLAAVETGAVYDVLRRKIQLNDPDSGVTLFKFNALNQVAREINANNTATTHQYDELGRRIRRVWDATTANPGVRTATWLYDTATSGAGELTQLNGYDTKGRSYEARYTYTTLGQLSTEVQTIAGQPYTAKHYYDSFGREQGLEYPSDMLTIGYSYGGFGQLQSVYNARQPASEQRTLRLVSAQDAWGNTTSESHLNGVATTRSYRSDNGRIVSISAVKGGLSIINQTYDFDKIGNLKSRGDGRVGISQYFCYDELNRLRAAKVGSPCGVADEDFAYDAIGNLLRKGTDIGSATYAGPQPHAITQAVSGGQTLTYQYDNAGRMTSRNGGAVVYAPFGKPTLMSSSGKTTEIVYGPDEERIQRIDNGTRTTTYFGKLFERVEEYGEVTRNFYVDDFAMYTDVSSANESDSFWLYLHRDYLGSIVAESNGNPQSIDDINWQAYGPWGGVLSESWAGAPSAELYFTQRGFTNHEHLMDVGLIHMNGRVYDPILGRLISPDPVLGKKGNIQSYNRYSYVENNPLAFIDPTGNSLECTPDGACRGSTMEGVDVSARAPLPVFYASQIATLSLLNRAAEAIPNATRNFLAWNALMYVDPKAGIETLGSAIDKTIADVTPPWLASSGADAEAKDADSADKGNNYPDRELPRDKHGNPVADPEAGGAHSQLGQKDGRNGKYDQAREFDANGKPVRDIDFTDHGRPGSHPNPHQHDYLPNSTGGTPMRGPTRPLGG